MATDYGNKSIVTDGLIFNVDASNKQSYPGSGTTALDFISSSTTRVETTFNPLTSVGANNDFTVSAWVKPDNGKSFFRGWPSKL